MVLRLLFILLLSAPTLVWSRTLLGSFPKHFAQLNSKLSKRELAEVKVGYSLFSKPWVEAPSSTIRRDGLGPHFSAVSCMSCHRGMGRGAPQGVIHPNDPSVIFKPVHSEERLLFGDQITPKALPGVTPEGWVRVSEDVAIPRYTFGGDSIEVSARVAPHLAGLGKLEKIPRQEIEKNAQRGGTLPFVGDKLGRFGWKADKVNLAHQVAAAFSFDMGITNKFFPEENCQEFDGPCQDAISGADEEGVEIREDHLMMVVKLMQSIEPPKPLRVDAQTLRGKEVFKKVNCQSCHRISYDIGDEIIEPYTDLLLHDLGEGLSDKGSQPRARQWRTPPLWGLGSQRIVNGHTRYLHDGRAKNLEEAILWHGGEAVEERKAYSRLSKADKKDLLEFLGSL